MKWEPLRLILFKSRAEMIRKVYEGDPMLCLKCGGEIKVVAFVTHWIRSREVHCAAVPRHTAADESKKGSRAFS